jgi:phosphatidylglycerophosphate synthase
MLDWHLGMVEGSNGAISRNLASADALTLSRFWLVPFAACHHRRPGAFATLVGVGAATDLLDGRLAARAGPTRLGRDLDTTADLTFFGAAALGAYRSGWLSPTGALAVTIRSVAPVIFVASHYFIKAARPPDRPKPNWSAVPFVAGLATAPIRPRLGNVLVAASCIGLLLEKRFSVLSLSGPEPNSTPDQPSVTT